MFDTHTHMGVRAHTRTLAHTNRTNTQNAHLKSSCSTICSRPLRPINIFSALVYWPCVAASALLTSVYVVVESGGSGVVFCCGHVSEERESTKGRPSFNGMAPRGRQRPAALTESGPVP